LILATGGPALVKAAYSSGNPAIGVAPGNAPVLICADADLQHAANSIIMSKTFDHGLICGAEHNLVVDSSIRANFIEILEQHGAAVLSPDEVSRFMQATIDPAVNNFKGKLIGQPASLLADMASIQRDYPIKLIVVPTEGINAENALVREKMLPVLSLFSAADTRDGFEACKDLLIIDGSGHTAIIYSQDSDVIERFGAEIPASRLLVNSPGTHGVFGITTGLIPSLTLSCGTFGGNSTTDNVTYTHLLNIKRLAYYTPERNLMALSVQEKESGR
jgi:acetaldehyde dehydrogenase/alcohol dehydrogenase